MEKLFDLCVKTRTYTDREGNQKNSYENVGTVMDGKDGNAFIILKRTFNPAGVPNPDNKDSIIISMFKPKQQEQQQTIQRSDEPPPPTDDDIPF